MKPLLIIIFMVCVSCQKFHDQKPPVDLPVMPVILDSIPVNPFEKAALMQDAIDTVINP